MAHTKRSQSSMTVSEAGQRGGKTTASTHGREFYQDIGRKGGSVGGPRVRELVQKGKKSKR
jgi:general stress protein YciG